MSGQHGAFSRSQARAAGMTDTMLKHALRRGRIVRPHPGVYCVAAAPKTWQQAIMATCLRGGEETCASHRTAAALLGLPGFAPGVVEVSTLRNLRSPPSGVLVHRTTTLPPCDRCVINGIPVTEATRTLIDLAAVASFEAVEVALDDALRRRLTTLRRWRWRLEGVGAGGKKGAAALRRLLDDRPLGTVAPESPLEGRFIRLLKREGLPPPQRQYAIRAGGEFVARVDFAYPEAKVAVEAVGRDPHERQWKRDLARMNALTKCGWIVIYVTWEDVHVRPRETVMTIAQALGIAF